MQDQKKISLGQFFTRNDTWLHEHIREFIMSAHSRVVYDPFAGNGDILRAVGELGFHECRGLDIDETLSWEVNDSLMRIPHVKDAIIITNPPYLSNYSAARKKIRGRIRRYFDLTEYPDLYLLALERMLDAQDNVVAIVPETFIHAQFARKNRLHSLTILENNPFWDTDCPVCVACFDRRKKEEEKILVYKDNRFINTLAQINQSRPIPRKRIKIVFNAPDGWLALRAIDSTDPALRLAFDLKERMSYDWEHGIKVSSRLYSLIALDVPGERREALIAEANRILNEIRIRTEDVILSPFKGNMKNGVRRRRLDFHTARAILEEACAGIQCF